MMVKLRGALKNTTDFRIIFAVSAIVGLRFSLAFPFTRGGSIGQLLSHMGLSNVKFNCTEWI
jgi:hypothetical protein